MNIELAASPETIDAEKAAEVAIRLPLTAPPDELLMKALERSPQISSFCDRLEATDQQLVIRLQDDRLAGLGTVLTAIQSLLSLTNAERAAQDKADEQIEAEAAEAKRTEVDVELQQWWEQRG
jgi:hypothetical protein